MTDTTNMLNGIISSVRQLDTVLQLLKDISDRISADSNLSTRLAATASTVGRSDLVVADFDNLNLAVQALSNHLNTAGLSANPPVNTGGTLKLAYYKIM